MATSSAGPKNALMVEITKFRTRMANTFAPERDEQRAADRPTEVGRDHDPPRIAPLHEDAGQGAEDDGRDEEGEDQEGVGRVRASGSDHDRHERGKDHVAGQLTEDLGRPQEDEVPVSEDAPGSLPAGSCWGVGQLDVGHAAGSGPCSRWPV